MDTDDAFDPASAAAAGVRLDRLSGFVPRTMPSTPSKPPTC